MISGGVSVKSSLCKKWGPKRLKHPCSYANVQGYFLHSLRELLHLDVILIEPTHLNYLNESWLAGLISLAMVEMDPFVPIP